MMYEYKVISHDSTRQLEVDLNRWAAKGWRLVFQHFDPKGVAQWCVTLERERASKDSLIPQPPSGL